jgi:CMP-N-acetylneuraminic acid synthetase
MIALLPMKAHSERVPGKNIRLLDDKPLFCHIADTLRQVEKIDSLVINTDSQEIGEFAEKRYGSWVEVIERPDKLCGDQVPMNAIIAYDVERLGIKNDYIQTHSTNPLLRASTIERALKEYFDGKSAGKLDSIFSVNALHTRLYDSKLQPINHSPDKLIRTQDLDVVYEENSNFYIFSGHSFLVSTHRIGTSPMPFMMSRRSLESLDIDDAADWDFAEFIICNKLYNA